MSPLGVSCFGKEPFTWGVYDDRRTSASTQSATGKFIKFRFRGIFLYTVVVLHYVDWCIRQL